MKGMKFCPLKFILYWVHKVYYNLQHLRLEFTHYHFPLNVLFLAAVYLQVGVEERGWKSHPHSNY